MEGSRGGPGAGKWPLSRLFFWNSRRKCLSPAWSWPENGLVSPPFQGNQGPRNGGNSGAGKWPHRPVRRRGLWTAKKRCPARKEGPCASRAALTGRHPQRRGGRDEGSVHVRRNAFGGTASGGRLSRLCSSFFQTREPAAGRGAPAASDGLISWLGPRPMEPRLISFALAFWSARLVAGGSPSGALRE